MKNAILFVGASALFLASCVSNPDGKKAETSDSTAVESTATGSELNVDTTQSVVAWRGNKVSGSHNGTVKIKSGSLSVANGKITGGNFVMDLNTITDVDLSGEYKTKLETHLKSGDFFDVANHPEATFAITEAKDSTISGNLTIRGVSKNITFPFTTTELSETSVKAMADFNIAREDWGVSYTGQKDDLISKEINLKVTLVATK